MVYSTGDDDESKALLGKELTLVSHTFVTIMEAFKFSKQHSTILERRWDVCVRAWSNVFKACAYSRNLSPNLVN